MYLKGGYFFALIFWEQKPMAREAYQISDNREVPL